MQKHTITVQGRTVNITVANQCPPIPVRNFDWCAYEDGCEQDGIYGHGATADQAVEDLIQILEQ